MQGFRRCGAGVEWRAGQEMVRVEAWGSDSVRVRARLAGPISDDLPGALLEAPPADTAEVSVDADGASVVNGAIRAEVSADGSLRFLRSDSGEELAAEQAPHFHWPPARAWLATGNGYHRLEVSFRAYDRERFYGLGQHQHGRLDQKGAVIDLVQRNTEVSVPFMVSSRGYGFLWNSPGVGRVELGATATRWVADSIRQLDYWITAGSKPADILERYTAVTGRAPMFPEWASGFWQSRLRYRTQQELLDVAREHHRRGLPLSVMVVDFFHWTRQGEWRFDPDEWPDPAGMVDELADMGVKLMVSIWPTVNPAARTYDEMAARGLLVASEQGNPAQLPFVDKGSDGQVWMQFYDPTNPEARRYLWDQAREHYYRHGVRVWWLDACEPEMRPASPENLLYHEGPGREIANIYPMAHARGFYEGMRAEGEEDILLLCRSAWAGSQRYGVAVWSGDIAPTFEALQAQIPAGLNIAMAGIPWWTTDIGGFHGGDPGSAYFRELIVRWFQYAVFCPLLRLHGHREPRTHIPALMDGGPNEVWSFGDEAYGIISGLLSLRERLRPYIHEQMRIAHTTGTPPMRPLYFDFSDDSACADITDEFCFGSELLVAPVVEHGARSRQVYLPAGASWTDAWTGERLDGGQDVKADAPLDRIPVYLRDGADLPLHD